MRPFTTHQGCQTHRPPGSGTFALATRFSSTMGAPGIRSSGQWRFRPEGLSSITRPTRTRRCSSNVGAPETVSPLQISYGTGTASVDFLFLVNGTDDNSNGWVDEGWDGVDNNSDSIVDNNGPINPGVTYGEWETETWLGAGSGTAFLRHGHIYDPGDVRHRSPTGARCHSLRVSWSMAAPLAAAAMGFVPVRMHAGACKCLQHYGNHRRLDQPRWDRRSYDDLQFPVLNRNGWVLLSFLARRKEATFTALRLLSAAKYRR